MSTGQRRATARVRGRKGKGLGTHQARQAAAGEPGVDAVPEILHVGAIQEPHRLRVGRRSRRSVRRPDAAARAGGAWLETSQRGSSRSGGARGVVGAVAHPGDDDDVLVNLLVKHLPADVHRGGVRGGVPSSFAASSP